MRDPEFPDDTWAASTLRTLVDAVAWVAGPWAAGELLGFWAIPLAVGVIVGIPLALRRLIPMTPTTAGTTSLPGLVRVSIAIDMATIAVVAMWLLLGYTAGVATLLVALAAQAFSWPRSRWLLAGAPSM